MSRRTFPSIHPSDLRDHADEERIDRIWERLEPSLAVPETPSRKPTGTIAVLLAAALAAFAGGIFVGKSLRNDGSQTSIRPIASSDKDASTSNDLFAAGTSVRTFSLPGGGQITLEPKTIVELERGTGDEVKLHLVHGEAALDTTETNKVSSFAIVAEKATLSTRSGSVVRVRRGESDMDVRVENGSVSISSPSGPRELSRGQHEAVPIRSTVTMAHPEETLPQRPPAPVRAHAMPTATAEPPVALATAPDWWARYSAGDDTGALDLLKQQPGGIDGAIASANSAKELMAINDIARSKGGDPNAAVKALTQVVDRFPSDQYAEIAAYQLGKHYEKAGQTDLAQRYFEKARSLKGVLAEGALCKQIRAEHRAGRKDEAARMGKEYLSKYPDGTCKDDVERIVSGQDPAGEEPVVEQPPQGDASPQP